MKNLQEKYLVWYLYMISPLLTFNLLYIKMPIYLYFFTFTRTLAFTLTKIQYSFDLHSCVQSPITRVMYVECLNHQALNGPRTQSRWPPNMHGGSLND